VKKISY